MKIFKFYFVLIFLFYYISAESQRNVHWVGAATGIWHDGANWLDESAVPGVPDINDSVIFDNGIELSIGLDWQFASEVSELLITTDGTSPTSVSFHEPMNEFSNLTIGMYMRVDAGCLLELTSTGEAITVNNYGSADIFGTVKIGNGAHKLICSASTEVITFHDGATFISDYGLTDYPFGDSGMGMSSIIFDNGSNYLYYDGPTPFGSGTSGSDIVSFYTYSNFEILGDNGSLIVFSGKTYGNIINNSGHNIIVPSEIGSASTFSFNTMTTLNGALSFEGTSTDMIDISGYVIEASGGEISLQSNMFLFTNNYTNIGGTSSVQFIIEGPSVSFSMLPAGNTLFLDTDIEISSTGSAHDISVIGTLNCYTSTITVSNVNLHLFDPAKLITAHTDGFSGSIPNNVSFMPQTTFEFNGYELQMTGFANYTEPIGRMIINNSSAGGVVMDNDLTINSLELASNDFIIADNTLIITGNIDNSGGYLRGNIETSVLNIMSESPTNFIELNTGLHLESLILNTVDANVELFNDGTGERVYTKNTIINNGNLYINDAGLDITESLANPNNGLHGGIEAGLYIGAGVLEGMFDFGNISELSTFQYARQFMFELNNDLIIENLLLLDDGEILIGSSSLTINGNYESQGGVIGGTVYSILELNGINSSGDGFAITFNEARNDLKSLIMNRDFEVIDINSNLHIHDNLNLYAGKIRVSNYNLDISGATVSGASPESYIITGENGNVSSNLTGTPFSFPVGTYNYYAAVEIQPDAAAEFQINVRDSVYSNGYSGEVLTYDDLVHLTWEINSSNPSQSYNTSFLWDEEGAEGSDFDYSQMHLYTYDINQNEWADPNMNSYTFSPGSLSAISLSDYGLFMVSSHSTDPPAGGDNEVNTSVGVDYIFSPEDFNFSDINDDIFIKFKITQNVNSGALFIDYNGDCIIDADEEIYEMSEVLYSELEEGLFKYKPETNGTTDFKFKVNNGIQYSEEDYVMTIIIGSNTPPEAYDQVFTIPEHSPNGTEVGSIVFSDPDPGQILTLNMVTVHDPNPFELTNDYTIIVNNFDLLEYSLNPSFEYDMEVCDNGIPVLCTDFHVSINLEEDTNEGIVIANYLSPNHDNYNDTWKISGLDFTDIDVFIYSNSGNLVYESKGYRNDWNGTSNGKRLPAGVYYYFIKTTDFEDRGTITLVR